MPRLSPGKLGEVAELVFMARAAALGFHVLRPNAPCRYDLVLDTGSRLLRIQVKSTATMRDGRYTVGLYSTGHKWPYNPREIDFLAAWVAPENAWYIIPVRALRDRVRVSLHPHKSTEGWSERYRERWALLGSARLPRPPTPIGIKVSRRVNGVHRSKYWL